MLFNSYGFIFLFLPIALIGFYSFGRVSAPRALLWLTLVSLFFYAWWRPVNVLLIAPSILVNYGLARWMTRRQAGGGKTTPLLVVGIVFNVLVLGYFKYRNFFLDSVNTGFGTDFPIEHLILPLGISFITFQKIAFLVDVHGGRTGNFSFREYCLFVLFFPQLIAGPIVHYTEVMPQFRNARCRFDAPELTLGLTLFAMGLFKKVILADGISPGVAALYSNAAHGEQLSFVPAWLSAVGYTLQIYFDFSAYSDMALGLGKMFGVRLPTNFDSPLRATNIIDFWLRWHITLTRFLTAYIYNPLALSLIRRRIKKGLPLFGGAKSTLGAFAVVLVFPTMLVMLISGVWHGAGVQFAVWGLLHGMYLCCNHAWRAIPLVRGWRTRPVYHILMQPVGFAITFACVVFAMVFFGASSTATAASMVKGMVFLNGLEMWRLPEYTELMAWTVGLFILAVATPNTLRIIGWIEEKQAASAGTIGPRIAGLVPIRWKPNLGWAFIVAALGAVAVSELGGPSEFLYWQF